MRRVINMVRGRDIWSGGGGEEVSRDLAAGIPRSGNWGPVPVTIVLDR
jgi:hypothetical protein